MISAKYIYLALISVFIINGFAVSQQKRARDNYEYLFTLPNYSNTDALPVTRVDFTVTLRDGTILDALKFIPQGTPPAGGWPTVVFVHGYGDNKETLAGFAKAQAEYGYYTTTFSMRGQGHSTGLSNLISTTEAQDMIEFINFIKMDTPNGINPNNILVMGGSQGGLVPYMACTMGMNVRTIISALAPPNFASSWIENGCIKMTLLWTVEYTPDTARYTPQVDRMSNWIYSSTKNYWDSLAYWLPVNRDFLTSVPNNRVPLIMEGSWQDKFFNASGIMKASQLNNGSTFRLYLGAVQGHGGDNSPTEDTWHMQFFNDWFFYWLFPNAGAPMPVANYDYASTLYPANGLYWTFKHDSSKTSLQSISTPYRLYFNTNSRLTTTAGTTTNRVSVRNQVTGGLTMQEAVNEEFTGTVFTSKFKKNSVSFTTTALTSDKKWVGIPKVNLDYLSTASTFTQYNFQVLEVLPSGKEKLINRINYTDRNYTANSRRTKNFEGQAHSHIFKAGNKIKVIVTNLDTHADDQWFLGTNPFVLPVLNNGYNYMYLSANSYIELPLVNSVNDPVSDSNPENTPVRFSLNQNYPNPFNPVTVINYSIPVQGLVTLKIYDIAGREVKTLVSELKDAGEYNVSFNAGEFSSGVYFYSLVSGVYSKTKKMILVK